MMKNRAEKLVIKAFLELKTPDALCLKDERLAQRFGDRLRTTANRLLMSRENKIQLHPDDTLSKEDKNAINHVITQLEDGEQKWELVFFYRLCILVDNILLKYRA